MEGGPFIGGRDRRSGAGAGYHLARSVAARKLSAPRAFPSRLGNRGPMIEQLPTTTEDAAYIVTVRGLVLPCSIGIRARERERQQRVRISVDLVATDPFPGEERRRVINYEKVVAAIREIASSGHIELCEGFAEQVCTACLNDPRVDRV